MYALIDNATLTAVQRIQGDISTKSKDLIDVDIVAFENFLQAVLFYDDLISIDDYIPKCRDDRIASFPEVNFLKKSDFGLSEIEKTAQKEGSQLKPEIKGGEFANKDFRELFERLQTHIVCTWDICSSVYHLTLKSLSDNQEDFYKYGNITAAIFRELSDAKNAGARISSDVVLVDRFGKRIEKGYKVPGARWGGGISTGEASSAIKAFVASLVWLANRTIFYTLTAKYLRADTFLYPIRQDYQQNYLSRKCLYGINCTSNFVRKFASSLQKDLIDIQEAGLGGASLTPLPVFSAWFARETGDPSQIVKSVFSVRNNQEFVEARGKLREIRNFFDSGERVKVNKSVDKLKHDMSKLSDDIRVKYGLQTRQGIPCTKLIQVYNAFAATIQLPQLPECDFRLNLPSFICDLSKPKGFGAIYHNLSEDLSLIWALGEARDILGSRVITDDTSLVYNPKQEQPQFRQAHSKWKSPM